MSDNLLKQRFRDICFNNRKSGIVRFVIVILSRTLAANDTIEFRSKALNFSATWVLLIMI
jgi:hypothetical protein